MVREEYICGAIILIIVVGAVGYFGYNYVQDYLESNEAEKERGRLFVENGDTITFEVTARLDNGRIFYTTDGELDKDESQLRSSNYIFYSDEPDFAVVGEELISKFNQGFNDEVQNMKIDESKNFKVTPEKGYGWSNESLVKKIPINDQLPLYVTISTDEFQLMYNPEDIPIFTGQMFEHNYWKWPIELIEVNNETITYRNSPPKGFSITVLPWKADVTGISEKDNKLFIKHSPTNELIFTTVDSIELNEYDPTYLDIQTIQTDLGIGLLEGVITNFGTEYITLDFNDERAGRNLYYEVEIINIEKA